MGVIQTKIFVGLLAQWQAKNCLSQKCNFKIKLQNWPSPTPSASKWIDYKALRKVSP
jgi:hypothetical protein